MICSSSLVTGTPENLKAQSSRELETTLEDTTNIRILLQKSLDNDSFVLMAQPIVSTHSGERYHEILLRMLDDQGNFIPPNTFLPVANAAGLATEIDMWVIRHTLKTMRQHPERSYAINLAPITVCRSEFIFNVRKLFAAYQIEPQRVIFEITETELLSDLKQSTETIRLLRELGCRVAIDDFGTGFASHARLMSIDADILKVDGSFIRRINESDISHYIVESFCHVAKMKGMQVVAEYVENAEIQSSLERMRVDWLQGYHVGKPVPLLTLV